MAGNQTFPIEMLEQAHSMDGDRRMAGIATSATCLTLIWLAIALRFLARRYAIAPQRLENGMVVVSLIFSTAFMITTGVLFDLGAGQHEILLLTNSVNLQAFNKMILVNTMLDFLALMTIKLCVIILLISTSSARIFRRVLLGTAVLVFFYTMASMIVLFVQCVPLSATWDHSEIASCLDITIALTALGTMDAIANVTILFLAVLVVRRLDGMLLTRWQLSTLFSVGALTIIVSIVRTIYVSRISLEDSTWTRTDPLIWSNAELTLSILCACLPTYRTLLNKNLRRRSQAPLMNDPRAWFGRKSSRAIPSDPELAESTIHVETTIENSWDEHYRVSQCPTPANIWDDDQSQGCPSRSGLSRPGSSRMSTCQSQIWIGTSRPTSQRPSRSGSIKKILEYPRPNEEVPECPIPSEKHGYF